MVRIRINWRTCGRRSGPTHHSKSTSRTRRRLKQWDDRNSAHGGPRSTPREPVDRPSKPECDRTLTGVIPLDGSASEGWFVQETFRHRGVGGELMRLTED